MRLELSGVVLTSGVLWLISILPNPALGEERPNAPTSENEAQASQSDAALGGLLRSPRVTIDPAVAQLEALMAELAQRPMAKTAGKPGLDRARVELARLRELIDRRADAESIARKKQMVWAALSTSDRQMARAELAMALRAALSQREQAEAQLRAAKLARDPNRVEHESQKLPKPSPIREPAK
jgi:hypothetical protein